MRQYQDLGAKPRGARDGIRKGEKGAVRLPKILVLTAPRRAGYRSLGMSSQLPAFQGNVPVQLKGIVKDANITCQQGNCEHGTGWMNSVDPLYAK